MRFTAEISCFESTFDTDTIEELDEDGDVGDLQVKKKDLSKGKYCFGAVLLLFAVSNV